MSFEKLLSEECGKLISYFAKVENVAEEFQRMSFFSLGLSRGDPQKSDFLRKKIYGNVESFLNW